ncbi:MAG: sugar phosphate isomerase/epimerase [Clostridia bacterium]|nr:sugar phosphate isomerase/epimerase [Clostridia bacterium]
MMKPAVSSYSFHQYIKAGKMTQLDVIAKAAELGFAGVDYTDLAPVPSPTPEEQLAYAAEIRREAEKYGVEIVAYTVGANLYQGSAETDDAEVARLCGQVDVAEALGAKIMRHDVCSSERVGDRFVGFERMLPVIAANARRVTEYAQAKGIRTCSENHGYVAQDSDRVKRLYYAVDHENYGLLLDVGNFACVDENSALAVSRLAPYAIHVHAKDFVIHPFGFLPREGQNTIRTRACQKLEGCAIGDGNIPVEQCVAILKKAKYDGFVTIEYEGNEDCVEGIARGLQRLTRYISE